MLGKHWPLGFPLLLCFLYAVLIDYVPFPYGVCGRMWSSIVSVPDQCIFIYFSSYFPRIADFLDTFGSVRPQSLKSIYFHLGYSKKEKDFMTDA